MGVAVAARSLACSRAKPPHARILSIRPTWSLQTVANPWRQNRGGFAGMKYRRQHLVFATPPTRPGSFQSTWPAWVSPSPTAMIYQWQAGANLENSWCIYTYSERAFQIEASAAENLVLIDASLPVNPHDTAAHHRSPRRRRLSTNAESRQTNLLSRSKNVHSDRSLQASVAVAGGTRMNHEPRSSQRQCVLSELESRRVEPINPVGRSSPP
jgi:hypothetical protein